MVNPVVERYGSLSATGAAEEPSFATTTSPPTTFWPMTGNELQLDPGLFSPKVMFGQRDLNTFPLFGQFKNSGGITGPLFPTNGALFIPNAIGPDAQASFGVVGTVGTGSTTSTAPTIAGATSISVTSATGFATGNIVQIDVNNTVGPTTSECRKITVSGTTFTLDKALTYAHASGINVIGVVAPYTHSIQQANLLGSLTVEKNLGSWESLQFTGARVNKLSVTATATDTEAVMSADMVAKSVAVLTSGSTSPIAITNESPFVFAEVTVSLFGQTVAQASSFSLDIENGLKSTYTMNSTHNLNFLTPVTRRVSGKIDVVFTSLDDATWGYFNQMVAGTTGTLTITLAHPSTGGSVVFTMPKVLLKRAPDAVKMEDVIMTSLEYEVFLNLTTLQTISATIIDQSYLPL